jgi:hypothetical protein
MKNEKERAELRGRATKLWAKLGDIPIDNEENLEEKFEHFPIGTGKFEIWGWFEDEFDLSVFDLMYPNHPKIIEA